MSAALPLCSAKSFVFTTGRVDAIPNDDRRYTAIESHEGGIDFHLTPADRRLAADAALELQRQRIERNRRDALRRRTGT